MSSLALLNRYGLVEKKLHLISLQNDYVIPEGMTLSWKAEFRVSSSSPLAELYHPQRPPEALFYLGNARGQVSVSRSETRPMDFTSLSFANQNLVVTVQSDSSAKDLMELRDKILNLIHSGAIWGPSNDLNPKPKQGFWQRLRGLWE